MSTDNPRVHRTTDPEKLTAKQRKLVARAAAAHRRVVDAQAKAEAAVKTRDDLIRDALTAQVGVTLIGEQVGLTRGMVWKIREGATTQEIERRRET